MNERPRVTEEDIKRITAETVAETLTLLGVNAKEPLEMQRDFQHLRDWRVSTEAAKRKGVLAAIGFVVVGGLGLAWVGFKQHILP